MTPAVPAWISAGLTALPAVFWLWVAWHAWQTRLRPPALGDAAPLPDRALPSLAIVVTAKDEAVHVEEAALSLLAQDYPGARVLIVDDRSRDGTGAILDRIAAAEPRLEVLHLDALPGGWIGKCHALARGAALVDTEWILFTDGDIVMAPDAVRRAVSLALRDGLDHLAVGPEITSETLGERMFVAYFLAVFNASQRPWRAPDPRAKDFVGIGAFNLVRREAYLRAGGHERLGFEVIDDMALGKILKRSGARQQLAKHSGLLATRWHRGVRGLVRGIEKNAFGAARYSAPFMSAATAGLLYFAAMPYAGWLLPGAAVRAFTLLAWAGVFLTYQAGSGTAGIRWWHGLLLLPGALLYNYAMARSMVLALRRGGIRWRDTFYPLAELRRKQVF